jgi:hypothetical protein
MLQLAEESADTCITQRRGFTGFTCGAETVLCRR